MISALLGTLVEVGGYQPVFAHDGETPIDALQRHHPRVALVDCDRADACEELFLSRGSEQKTSVVLFSPRRLKDEVDAIAGQHGLRSFALPIDLAGLRRVLAEATMLLLLCLTAR